MKPEVVWYVFAGLISITAIVGIVILVSFAMYLGIDTICFGLGVASISAIISGVLSFQVGKKKR